jgi:hypothetical protein
MEEQETVAAPEAEQPATDVQVAEPQPETEAVEEMDAGLDEGRTKPKGVQKRIDELTGNWRKAERDRDYWRDLALQAWQGGSPAPEPEPVYDLPAASDGYAPAIDPQRIKMEAAQEARFSILVEGLTARLQDQDAKRFWTHPQSPISRQMADVILESEAPEAVLAHLGRNVGEAARIRSLPPHKQAYELAKLERMVTAPAPPPKASAAPAPVPVVSGSRASAAPDPSKMSTEQWMAWRNAQLRSKA